MLLTKNFTLQEMEFSSTAIRHQLDNKADKKIIENLYFLCKDVLQPLRNAIGKPIKVTSGYRCAELNQIINNGSKRISDHMNGFAADIQLIYGNEVRNDILFNTILDLDLPFKQLIWEFGDRFPHGSPSWVHISHSRKNVKKQILEAFKDNGQTHYRIITRDKSL
jgi:hypothetical protein